MSYYWFRSSSCIQVLSLSRNKITRLPSYFADLVSLETLGLDHNPIEWPPRGIMEPYPNFDDKTIMKAWIQCIQRWIGDHGTSPNRQASEDSVGSQGWPFPGYHWLAMASASRALIGQQQCVGISNISISGRTGIRDGNNTSRAILLHRIKHFNLFRQTQIAISIPFEHSIGRVSTPCALAAWPSPYASLRK
jgi:hypothetical protein